MSCIVNIDIQNVWYVTPKDSNGPTASRGTVLNEASGKKFLFPLNFPQPREVQSSKGDALSVPLTSAICLALLTLTLPSALSCPSPAPWPPPAPLLTASLFHLMSADSLALSISLRSVCSPDLCLAPSSLPSAFLPALWPSSHLTSAL